MTTKKRNWKEVIQEIEELYEIIKKQEEKVRRILYIKNIIRKPEERISFEYVDLSAIYKRLIEIIRDIEYYYNLIYRLSSSYKSKPSLNEKMYKVYLAGICEIIKQDYSNGTVKTYTRVTGITTTTKYYEILKNSFISERILPKDWEERKYTNRYQDVVIQESGIPTNLVNNIVKFFKIYWKYYKNKAREEKEEFFFLLNCKDSVFSNYIYQAKELELMKNLYNEIKDYPTKVKRVLRQLEEIYFLIEDSMPDGEINDIEHFCDKASKTLGYDILSVVPRKQALLDLYSTMINKVSINKFRNILKNKPENIDVILPNGVRRNVREYSKIIIGKHKLLGIDYSVVPDTSLELDDIIELPIKKVTLIGDDRVIYLSRQYFKVKIGQQTIEPHKIMHKEFIGYVWYGSIPKGIKIEVDGIQITPKQETYWNLTINYSWNFEKKCYILNAYIPVLRIFNEKYKNKKIRIKCEQSEGEDLIRYIDRNGYIGVESMTFPISNVSNNTIAVKILLDENILLDEKTIQLQEAYLFDRYTKDCFIPGRNIRTSGNLLLFVREDNIEIPNKDSFPQYEEYKYLNYNVYKFKIVNNTLDFIIVAGEYQWYFNESIELYLKRFFNNKSDITEIENYQDNIIYSISDINLEVSTNITDKKELLNITVVIEKENRIKEYALDKITYVSHGCYIINPEIIMNNFKSIITSYVGEWIISVYFKGCKYHSVRYNLIPFISIKPLKSSYRENEFVDVIAFSDIPCFYSDDGQDVQYQKRITFGKAKLNFIEGKPKSETLVTYVSLAGLNVEKRLEFTPKLWAAKIFNVQDRSILNSNRVDIKRAADLDILKILVVDDMFYDITINVNGYSEKLNFYNGYIMVSLIKYINIFHQKNKIELVRDKEVIRFDVIWSPVIKFEKLDCFQSNIRVKYLYEGPKSFNFNIIVSNEFGEIVHSSIFTTVSTRQEVFVDIDTTQFFETSSLYIKIVDDNYEMYVGEVKVDIPQIQHINISKHRNFTIKEIISNKENILKEFERKREFEYNANNLKQDVYKVFCAALSFAKRKCYWR
ncbi:MAG: hypothetical protein HPY74_07305 [Firmicutes bacterium]|nr:hypothetical protein [Bacillota bacterium]